MAYAITPCRGGATLARLNIAANPGFAGPASGRSQQATGAGHLKRPSSPQRRHGISPPAPLPPRPPGRDVALHGPRAADPDRVDQVAAPGVGGVGMEGLGAGNPHRANGMAKRLKG